jgi:hypothetical protein
MNLDEAEFGTVDSWDYAILICSFSEVKQLYEKARKCRDRNYWSKVSLPCLKWQTNLFFKYHLISADKTRLIMADCF